MWVLKDNKKSKWHSYRISDNDFTNLPLERKELYTKEDDLVQKDKDLIEALESLHSAQEIYDLD